MRFGLVAVIVGTIVWQTNGLAQVGSSIPPEPINLRNSNLSFEVTSVKENPSSWRDAGPPMTQMYPSGRFVAERETVRRLMRLAYSVLDHQLIGGPQWISEVHFDIAAKAPDGFEMSQTRAMLRGLLRDRFNLVVRRELRAMPVYTLERLGRGHVLGSGIREARGCDDTRTTTTSSNTRLDARSRNQRNSDPSSDCRSITGFRNGSIFIRGGNLSSLVAILTEESGRPVIDRTGLTGLYDIDIRFSGGPTGEFGASGDSRSDPSLFTAVREQLGLKLAPTSSQVDTLVIVRVDRPTAN